MYVLPTHAEGLPIAILETMAGGNAVVSTDVGSIASVVDESNGAVVEPGDVDALVSATKDVLRDPETTSRTGAESRRVEADHTWSGVADELVSLYARLLDRSVETTEPTASSCAEHGRTHAHSGEE